MYKRKAYYKVIEAIEDGSIPIIVGHRRTGKTTILEQIRDEHENSMLIEFDEPKYVAMSNEELLDHLRKIVDSGIKVLLLDEVQEIIGWDIIVKKLFDFYVSKGKLIVAVTGSSSLSFSNKDTGVDRTEIIMLGTLDFSEYCQITGKDKTFDNFESYMELGGFPKYSLINAPVEKQKRKVLWPILRNDIPKEFGTRSFNIEKLLLAIASCTNGEFNREQYSQRTSVARALVDEYIDIFEQCLILKKVYRLDDKGNMQKYPKYKIYILPQFHLWLLERNWSTIDEKFKGHLIEAYWLFAHQQQEGYYQRYHYVKNVENYEVDLAFPEIYDKDNKFKKLIEFKYSDSLSYNDFKLMNSIKSKEKIVVCKENKKDIDLVFKSILDEF